MHENQHRKCTSNCLLFFLACLVDYFFQIFFFQSVVAANRLLSGVLGDKKFKKNDLNQGNGTPVKNVCRAIKCELGKKNYFKKVFL